MSDDRKLDSTPTIADALAAIERAFDGVPPPGEGSRTLRQAEAWDNYETCDRSRDHFGRWQDLPDDHLRQCQWALPHLDVAGMHYYLPAAMSFTLRTQESEPLLLHDSVGYTLMPSEGSLRAYQRERFDRFSPAQREAILAFLTVSLDADESTLDAWRRVVEADLAGEEGSWIERLWGE